MRWNLRRSVVVFLSWCGDELWCCQLCVGSGHVRAELRWRRHLQGGHDQAMRDLRLWEHELPILVHIGCRLRGRRRLLGRHLRRLPFWGNGLREPMRQPEDRQQPLWLLQRRGLCLGPSVHGASVHTRGWEGLYQRFRVLFGSLQQILLPRRR